MCRFQVLNGKTASDYVQRVESSHVSPDALASVPVSL